MKDNPWAAIGCWIFAAFTGGLVAFIVLVLTWRDYGSLLRKHAALASTIWAIILAIYLPTFAFGLFWPALRGNNPAGWVIWVAVGSVVVGWGSAAVGAFVVWRNHRHALP